jgi:hypothetical protein
MTRKASFREGPAESICDTGTKYWFPVSYKLNGYVRHRNHAGSSYSDSQIVLAVFAGIRSTHRIVFFFRIIPPPSSAKRRSMGRNK